MITEIHFNAAPIETLHGRHQGMVVHSLHYCKRRRGVPHLPAYPGNALSSDRYLRRAHLYRSTESIPLEFCARPGDCFYELFLGKLAVS